MSQKCRLKGRNQSRRQEQTRNDSGGLVGDKQMSVFDRMEKRERYELAKAGPCRHCGHSLGAHLEGFCISRIKKGMIQCGCENFEERPKGAKAGQTILEESSVEPASTGEKAP